MILIADSGSTKTDWIFCSKEKDIIKKVSTAGLNPMVQKAEFVKEVISNAFADELLSKDVRIIQYFGAGCSSDERKKIVQDILTMIFPKAEIYVGHDMQAAVIATCGDDAGIACILGTGSNAVLYDGEKIVRPKGVLGTGYILGDEGSGAYIGRRLLRDFLYRRMPENIYQHFEGKLQLTTSDILLNVYQRPNPNTYMASFTKEISEYKETAYMKSLLQDVFEEFFELNITQFADYQNYPIHFIGSIATHFETELRAVATSKNLKVGEIIQKPIDNIVQYFLERQ
ncbi:MAG: hypothetical protein M9887_07085 [Chitinophagales bacterium]|nr:hypothetical protein [Chitinophagales bacterium]